jgi:WD40 repeat protein
MTLPATARVGAVLAALVTGACAQPLSSRFLVIAHRTHPYAGDTLVPVAQDGHAGPLSGLDIDPSGSLVVTASGPDIRLWELPGGRLRARVDNAEGDIRGLAFAQSHDSDELKVLYSDDHGLKQWQLSTDAIRALAPGVGEIAVGSHGEIAAAQGSTLVHGYDASRLEPLLSLRDTPGPMHPIDLVRWSTCPVRSCGFAYRLIAADKDGRIVTFDLDRDRRLNRLTRPWDDPCGQGETPTRPDHLALSLDGKRVAAASAGRIHVWEFNTLRRPDDLLWERPLRSTCLRSQPAAGPVVADGEILGVAALQFDRDSDLLRIVGDDGSLRSWDLARDEHVVQVAHAILASEPGLAKYTTTRRWLAYAAGGDVSVWTTQGAHEATFRVAGPPQRVKGLDLSARGRIALAREDRVEVWTPETGALECHDSLAGHAAWSPDGRRLAAWADHGPRSTAAPRLVVIDEASDLRRELPLPDATFPLPPFAWTDDRHIVVPLGSALTTLNVDTSAERLALDLRSAAPVRSLAVAGDRVALVIAEANGDVLASAQLVAPHALLWAPVLPTSGPVAISPDGARIGTSHGLVSSTLWDAGTLRPVTLITPRGPGPLFAELLAFSPAGIIRSTRDRGAAWLRSPKAENSRHVKVRGRQLAIDVADDASLVAVAASDGIQLHRLDAKSAHYSKALLTSDTASGCEGVAVVDGRHIDASTSSKLLVRLGSPLAGALLPAHELPAEVRPDRLMQRFIDGDALPGAPTYPGVTELRSTYIYQDLLDRRLIVFYAPAPDRGVLCLDVRFTDARPPVHRCVDFTFKQALKLPDGEIASIWARACDASRTRCSRPLRASVKQYSVRRRGE